MYRTVHTGITNATQAGSTWYGMENSTCSIGYPRHSVAWRIVSLASCHKQKLHAKYKLHIPSNISHRYNTVKRSNATVSINNNKML